MKRIIYILIVMVMAFGLVACGSGKGTESSSTAPDETTNAVAQVETETEKLTETQTEKPEGLTSTKEYLFSEVYASKETCDKIVEKLDGLMVNKGDTIDLSDIGFSAEEQDMYNILRFEVAYALLSDFKSGQHIFTSRSVVKFNVSYDEEKITIMYTVYE